MKNSLLLFLFLVSSVFMYAQEQEPTPTVDPSKPTNLYTQVNAQAEWNHYSNYDTYGARFNFQYALNANNLILAELPFLYNAETKKLGLGDTRVRYFNVQRLKSKTMFAWAPFLDIYIPTGKSAHGLGGGTWQLSGGLIAGLEFSESFSMFPGVSYVYLTRIEKSGVEFQTNFSLKFSDRTFVSANPNVTFINSETIWQAELNINQILILDKLKANIDWAPNFTNRIQTFRLGVTFFI